MLNTAYVEKFKKKLNSYDPIMSIWVHQRLIQHLEKVLDVSSLEDRPSKSMIEIENLESLKDVKYVTFSYVNKSIKTFIPTENSREVIYKDLIEYMEIKLDFIINLEFRRLLNLIEDDRRFAHFFWALYGKTEVKNIIRTLESKSNLLIENGEESSSQIRIKFPYTDNYKNLNIIINKDLVIDKTPKYLISTPKIEIYSFEKFIADYKKIKKNSRTIDQKFGHDNFIEWLFDYLSKSVNFPYTPLTLKEKKELMQTFLDHLSFCSPQNHKKLVDKIQRAWNKRVFDKKKLSKD